MNNNNPYLHIPISNLLDEYLSAFTNYMDYLNRADHIVWTQAAEDIAAYRYHSIRNEIERRCQY